MMYHLYLPRTEGCRWGVGSDNLWLDEYGLARCAILDRTEFDCRSYCNMVSAETQVYGAPNLGLAQER